MELFITINLLIKHSHISNLISCHKDHPITFHQPYLHTIFNNNNNNNYNISNGSSSSSSSSIINHNNGTINKQSNFF